MVQTSNLLALLLAIVIIMIKMAIKERQLIGLLAAAHQLGASEPPASPSPPTC
jgi:hypothetical protein